MRKLVFLVIIVSIFTACELVETDENMNAQMSFKSAGRSVSFDTLIHNKYFAMNLVGKKDGWNSKEFNNPNRRSIFIPKDTEGWEIELDDQNGFEDSSIPGIRIDMIQGDGFKILDGSVFDGDKAEFSLGKGEYKVFIAAPGTNNANWYPNDSLIILPETWFYPNDTLFPPWPFDNLVLGEVEVNRTWTDITDLFTINAEEADPLPFDPAFGEEQWIFDYFNWLAEQPVNMGDINGDGIDDIGLYVNRLTFMQLQNNGSPLIKVRFYPVE